MDDEVMAAIKAHEKKFGEFNANILGINFGDAKIKARFIAAVESAIESEKPISSKSLGTEVPADSGILI